MEEEETPALARKDNSSPPCRGKISRPKIITNVRNNKSLDSNGVRGNATRHAADSDAARGSTSGGGNGGADGFGRKSPRAGSLKHSKHAAANGSQTLRHGASPPNRRYSSQQRLDSSSASSLPVLPLVGAISGKCADSQEDENTRLKIALQTERNAMKQLRRETMVQLKQVREEEQHKAVLLLKDMKSRLHFEKARDLEAQKDTLNKKYEVELSKVVKVKDTEARKLQADVQKLQDELQLSNASATNGSGYANGGMTSYHAARGLSGSAAAGSRPAATFESERVKLQKEIQELLNARKTREEELATCKEREKQLLSQMKAEREDYSAKLLKLKKETDVEIRRLVSSQGRPLTQYLLRYSAHVLQRISLA